jgi:hypothetical protein
MDAELAKALKLAREKVKSGEIKDFQLILDVAEMSFVWVSEEAAKLSGETVPSLIGDGFFETGEISSEELRGMIVELSRSGGKYTIPFSTLTGTKRVELEFKPIYVSKERPFLVGNIVKGL